MTWKFLLSVVLGARLNSAGSEDDDNEVDHRSEAGAVLFGERRKSSKGLDGLCTENVSDGMRVDVSVYVMRRVASALR